MTRWTLCSASHASAVHEMIPPASGSSRSWEAHPAAQPAAAESAARERGTAIIENRVSGLIGALAAALGLTVLIGGWALDIERLTRLMPGQEAMKANTALCLVLVGAALWLICRAETIRGARIAAKILGAAGGAIGAATLAEYVTGHDLGIDQLLFADPGAVGVFPGRMASTTAISFVLFAFSVICIDARSKAMAMAGDSSALAAGFFGQVAFIGYLYGSKQFYALMGYTAMAPHTSAAIVALAIAVVLARTNGNLSRILLDAGIVGRTVRRLLMTTILTIVGLGQIRMMGENWGIYDTEFGLALFATSVITVLTSVLVFAAAALRRFELAERRALQIAKARGDQFMRLVANVPGGVFTRQADTTGTIRFTYLSPPINEIFGIDRTAALDDPKLLLDRIHSDDRAGFVASIAEAARKFANWSQEFRIIRPGGELRWLRSQAQPYRQASGEAAWDGIVIDITEHRRRDEQLHHAQKMEAVGQLTGGVAHDFNNLLTVILGNAEMLREALPADSRLKRLADMTARAAERGAELTRRLLAFSRKQALQPKLVDVCLLVRQMESLLRRALGEQVEIALVLAHDLWLTKIDPAQLEAAILNLAVNARDAMPDGGKLTIEVANVEIDADYASRNEGVAPGCYVMIAVSDTGTGMSPEVAVRAFDPFFTTKEVGKGSGLGLSMVYGFIKQSSGHVKVYSEPGHGTTVKLYLPRSTDAAPAEVPVARQRTVTGGRETILMVEDDDLVRAHVGGLLGELGYDVLVARNGPEALEALRRNPTVDLIFSDVVMPGGMNGRQLAEAARRHRPGLKVLYTSGYTDNAIVHNGMLDPGIELLSKPYTREALALRLRAVLDRSAA